ncbi:MAG TPA: TMEM175 family protein [Thermoleophilaceae bacterium]|nr:TMEM175 family protein [Thermoleophilaceae bacterium]
MKRKYPRGEEEFGRVLSFSDGVYAIAITLLVLSIDLPHLSVGGSANELLDSLSDTEPQIISYAISFAVIGRFWIAHHQFFSRLHALDGGVIALNLVSLAVIAFLPFPTDVLGNYFENPVAVALYAVNVAAISALEVLMFDRAHKQDLLDPRLSESVFRWSRAGALAPVVFFSLSVPVAFVSSALACVFWFGGLPYQVFYLNRRKPADADTQLR